MLFFFLTIFIQIFNPVFFLTFFIQIFNAVFLSENFYSNFQCCFSADEKFDGTYPTNVVVTNEGHCTYIPPGIFKVQLKLKRKNMRKWSLSPPAWSTSHGFLLTTRTVRWNSEVGLTMVLRCGLLIHIFVFVFVFVFVFSPFVLYWTYNGFKVRSAQSYVFCHQLYTWRLTISNINGTISSR